MRSSEISLATMIPLTEASPAKQMQGSLSGWGEISLSRSRYWRPSELSPLDPVAPHAPPVDYAGKLPLNPWYIFFAPPRRYTFTPPSTQHPPGYVEGSGEPAVGGLKSWWPHGVVARGGVARRVVS